MRKPSGNKGDELAAVTPLLCEYTDRILYDEVWERPGLSKRDREPDHRRRPHCDVSP
ncbi:MAG: hypothetical protein NVV62_13450 [Terricaulis sp.]|nr:hypothetical protein [Terricaulis sp.]